MFGRFDIHAFEDISSDKEHVALTLGELGGVEPMLTRIHSECLTGDALFSLRCDCGAQLRLALEMISDEGRGVLLYLRQEGRGIGLSNKIRAYDLQDQGADTVEANEQLGFGADIRDYSICRKMLEHLGVRELRLLTNNPRKVTALEEMDFKVVERIALRSAQTPHNQRYLETKAGKLGHWME